MDSSNVKQDIERLVKGFTSLDPNEFDAAIHEFFKADASIDNSILKIKGASRIRDFTALQAQIADSNQVVGKPSYDEKNQVVDFDFKRKFKSVPVLSSFLSGWYPCHAQFHLQSEGGSGKNGKLYVSKVNVKEKPQPPIVNAAFYYFLRPFFSLVAIFLSQVSSFYYRHIKDTWFQFIFAAFNEFFQGIWNVLLREQSHVSADANKWREAKGQDLRKMIDQAKSTAINVTNDVELRARNAGVPVDQYKKQAGEIAQDLQKRVQEATGYVQDQAGKAKKQAGDAKEQAEQQMNGAKDEAKKQAGNAKDQAEQKLNEAKDEAKKQADSNGNDNTQNGGKRQEKKSEKKQSKSQLQATEQEPAFQNEDVNPDDVPTTPLGGHDPTAPNAFSYAHAAEL